MRTAWPAVVRAGLAGVVEHIDSAVVAIDWTDWRHLSWPAALISSPSR